MGPPSPSLSEKPVQKVARFWTTFGPVLTSKKDLILERFLRGFWQFGWPRPLTKALYSWHLKAPEKGLSKRRSKRGQKPSKSMKSDDPHLIDPWCFVRFWMDLEGFWRSELWKWWYFERFLRGPGQKGSDGHQIRQRSRRLKGPGQPKGPGPLKTSQKALQKRGILMKSKDPGSGSQDLDHQIWISELKKRYLGHPLKSALAEPWEKGPHV